MTTSEILARVQQWLDPIESIVVIVGGPILVWQLILERRSSTLELEQAQTSNYLTTMETRNAVTEREISSPDLLGTYETGDFPRVKTLSDWNSLTELQKRRLLHLGTILSCHERSYAFNLSKRLSQVDLRAEMTALREIVTLPIFLHTWAYMREFYRADFTAEINKMLLPGTS